MVDFLGKIFVSIFGRHSWIATIIISMFPLIELKGGIPVGMSADFWGEYALSGTASFLFAMLGSCLVVPIIALIFRPIVEWLKRTKLFRKLGHMIDAKVKNHSDSFNSKNKEEKSAVKKTWAKVIFIFTFVAVPLPLTGVWTGTCVAVAIGLNFWQTCLSCILGNMVAGLIIATVCTVFPEFTTILFFVFLIVIVVFIGYSIIKKAVANHRAKKLQVRERITINADEVKVGHTVENTATETKVMTNNDTEENYQSTENNLQTTEENCLEDEEDI